MAAYQYIYVMKGLGKSYPGGREVLRDIWLSFLLGAKIGVLGLNGAQPVRLPVACAPTPWPGLVGGPLNVGAATLADPSLPGPVQAVDVQVVGP